MKWGNKGTNLFNSLWRKKLNIKKFLQEASEETLEGILKEYEL